MALSLTACGKKFDGYYTFEGADTIAADFALEIDGKVNKDEFEKYLEEVMPQYQYE